MGGWDRAGNSQRAPSAETSDLGALPFGRRPQPPLSCNPLLNHAGIRTHSFDPARFRATRPSFYGYEIQLFDGAGKPPTVHSSGSLYRYVAPRKNAILPAGQWNSIDIECAGPRIKVTLNGEQIVDVDQQKMEALRQKPLEGCVCLQNHGGTIEFRELRVRVVNGSRTKG